MSKGQGHPPLLRWAGSKRQVVPLLIEKAPGDFDRYVEPFAGSASLFFALAPSRALLSDTNEELIEFLQHIRTDPRRVYTLASNIPRSPEAYAVMRSLNRENLQGPERAARFFYLNRHCFNGVYRVNKNGNFNVPMGKKLPPFPTLEAVLHAAEALACADLRASDFEPVLAQCGSGDFVYADPPYSTANRHRGEYGAKMFDIDDLHRLCSALTRAVDRGVRVALSFPASPLLRNELNGWKLHKVRVRRTVAADANARGQGGEGLFLSYC